MTPIICVTVIARLSSSFNYSDPLKGA